MNLHPTDVAAVLAFLGVMLALGASAKLRDSSVMQYLAAGRNLSLPAFVATLVCTWYGGILGVSESVAYFGVGAWLLVGVPYYLFGLAYALIYSPRVREAKQISIPERMEARFGRGAALVAALLVFLLAVPAAHVLMVGTLIQLISGWSLVTGVLLATLVACVLLYRGGLFADVRMAIPAFVAMYAGFFAIAAYCWAKEPLPTLFHELAPSLRSWTGGQGWLAVFTFFVLGAWTLVDPAFHQRVTSTRSVQVGRAGVLVSVFCWMVFDFLSISTALYALQWTHPRPDNAQILYPIFAAQTLPPFLRGLFLCGLLGTILSALAAYTLVGGAAFGREIVARWRRSTSDEEAKTATRIGLFVAAGLAAVVGGSVQSVVQLWYDWAGVMVGALLVPVAASYGLAPWSSRMKPRWVAISMAAGFAVSLVWMIWGKTHDNALLQVTWFGQSFSLGTLIPAVAVTKIVLYASVVFEPERHTVASLG